MKPDWKSATLQKINDLKSLPFGAVSLDCRFNELNYKLLLLTGDCASDKKLMELLGKWRKENELWFNAQFPVTAERTTGWFKEKVTGAPDRLLFIIEVNNKYIGHTGLFRFDFEKRECEIDNIVRGEPGYPGIMENAIAYMMDWGRREFGLRSYALKVASNNPKALNLYRKLGFREEYRHPFIQAQGKEGLEWVEAPPGYDQPVKRYDILMRSQK